MNKPGYIPLVPFMPENVRYAAAYVPYQLDTDEFSLEEALKKGTLYTVLEWKYLTRYDGGNEVC